MAKNSTQIDTISFPIEDYFGNFIFTKDKNIWAGYRINRQPEPLNNVDFFDEYIQDGKGLLEDDSLEYHFMNKPEHFPVMDHINSTIDQQVTGEMEEEGKIFFGRAGEILESEIQMNEYDTYMFVKLTTIVETVNPIEFWGLLKKTVSEKLSEMAGMEESTEVLLSYYKNKEKKLFLDLLNYKQTERLTEEELERIVYYQFHRAEKKQPKRKLLPFELTEGEITSHKGYITIEQLDMTHYVAFLPVIKTASSTYGGAFVRNMQDSVPFQLESHVRVKFRHEKKDIGKTRKIRKRIMKQGEDQDQTDAILDDDEVILHGEERLKNLNEKMKTGEKRLCRVDFHFVISADSLELLEERISQLKFVLEKSTYKIYRPIVDHITLFNQSLIGSKFKFFAYEQIMTTGFVADLGLNLIKKVGNEYGMPLGRLITAKKFKNVQQALDYSSTPVWFNPKLAKKNVEGSTHRNGNTFIFGPPGEGKSALVKNIFLWSSFLGQRVLYVDPKNETELFLKQAVKKWGHIPEFVSLVDKINFISISEKESCRGMLDPLLFLPREKAINTAKDILSQLGEIHIDSQTYATKKTIINNCVDAVMNSSGKKHMNKVISLIADKDQDLADLLKSFNMGIGKMLLGDDNSTPINFTNPINVLGLEGLQLPTKEDLDRIGKNNFKLNSEQLVSNVIMEAVMKLVYIFSTDKNEDALIIYDEAGAFEHTPQGAYMMEDSQRKGRANNTDVTLVTQSQMDYDKQDKKELISYKFCFKPKTIEARKEALKLFEMPTNDENMKMLNNLKQGTCLFQDHEGRNEPIAIDIMFDEWKDGLKSTNTTNEQVQRALAMEKERRR